MLFPRFEFINWFRYGGAEEALTLVEVPLKDIDDVDILDSNDDQILINVEE